MGQSPRIIRSLQRPDPQQVHPGGHLEISSVENDIVLQNRFPRDERTIHRHEDSSGAGKGIVLPSRRQCRTELEFLQHNHERHSYASSHGVFDPWCDASSECPQGQYPSATPSYAAAILMETPAISNISSAVPRPRPQVDSSPHPPPGRDTSFVR